jgi:hypothetical protein
MHPNPDNEPVELQTALGRLVMCWAPLELMLDGICATLFHRFADGACEQELPRAFGRKISYVRRCLTGLPLLKPLRDTAVPLLDAIQGLADHWHWLIHGFNLAENPMLGAAEVEFGGLTREAKAYTFDKRRYTVPEISALSSQCLQVANVLGVAGHGLLQLSQIVGQKRDDTVGKVEG